MNQDVVLFNDLHKIGHFLFYLTGENSGQRRVLFLLNHYGDMTQKELQNYLSVKSSTMSEMVCKLGKKDLIKKRPSSKDKRSLMLSLTPQGKEAAVQARAALEELIFKLFECLSEEEKKQMSDLSEDLLKHWDELEKDGTLVSIERGINNV